MTTRLKRLLDSLEDLADRPVLVQLIQELREELAKPAVLWPEGVMEAVAEVISPSVWNPESQTFKSLDRRISWAVGVWQDRYGPMTDSQREYMASILIWAVRTTARNAGRDKRKLYSWLNQEISNLVNHDTVALGFKTRGPQMLDVAPEVDEMVAGLA